jgi:archaeal flagellar protein FlaF
MGLSISASAAIIFIASVIVFGNLLAAFDNFEQALVDARRDSTDRQDGVLHDRISITAVDPDNRTVTLLNEGTEILTISSLNLFLNGTLMDDAIVSTSVNGSSSTNIWFPLEALVISVDRSLNETFVQVVDANGVVAYH